MAGFLAAFERTAVVTSAAKAVGVDRRTVNRALHRWPSFAACFADAKANAEDILHAEAYRRAVQGVEESVWMRDANGNPVRVDVVRRYSDNLLMFLLKAANPEKYRDNVRQEVTGAGGAPLAAPKGDVVIVIHSNGREGLDPLLAGGNGNEAKPSANPTVQIVIPDNGMDKPDPLVPSGNGNGDAPQLPENVLAIPDATL